MERRFITSWRNTVPLEDLPGHGPKLSNGVDSGNADGWDIDDAALKGGVFTSGTTWSVAWSTRAFQIQVKGSAKAGGTPPPPSTDATLSGLTVAGGGFEPDAEPGLRLGHRGLHGGGGLRHRRGDGDDGDDRRGRDVRIPGLVRRRAHRRGHRHGRPPGGAGGGRETSSRSR